MSAAVSRRASVAQVAECSKADTPLPAPLISSMLCSCAGSRGNSVDAIGRECTRFGPCDVDCEVDMRGL